ncbi:S8 family serine peptidase [Nonomuraea sp. B19D2]|uniref:S8 family serine peptidase n=1 Tax=Nonomuraea sp. B19D2 TaxID=3159561 RepID=UPI0032DA91E3
MVGRVLLAGVVALFAVPLVPATALAEPVKCNPERGVYTVSEPWAQLRLDYKSVWPITRGERVTVAVIDSGIDPTHPQLRPYRFYDKTNTGTRDCVGHGTAVAGIIAARPDARVPFAGVAPGVRLVVFKQTNEPTGDPNVLAECIVQAADLGVDVINISMQTGNHPYLKNAIDYALAKDVVVVAAAGNIDPSKERNAQPIYPGSYPGVLAVGAAGPDGKRADTSNNATPVGVLAPGTDITSTWTGKAYVNGQQGTSFAAPYVAGVAALIRARYPKLSQEQVRWRIETTADGRSGKGTGAGMVNPKLAVNAILPAENAPVVAQPELPLDANAISRVPQPDKKAISVSSAVAVAALAGAGLVAVGGVVMPLGRKRGWRAGRNS